MNEIVLLVANAILSSAIPPNFCPRDFFAAEALS